MTDHTILLTADGLDSLRTGVHTIGTVDSHGRRVCLFPLAVWDSPASRPLTLIAVLTPRHLDLIELDPEGVTVDDTTRTTGWQIRLGAS